MLRRIIARPHRLAWVAVLVMLGVIAGGVACGPAVAAPQDEQRALDFTPGDAGQLFAIPDQLWASLNRFVFLIGFDFYSPDATHVEFATRVRQLSNYAELHAACLVWGNETFGTLQTLATELAKGDIKELLSGLQATLQSLRSNPSGSQSAFEQQADALNRRLTELSALSTRVNQQFMALYNLGTAAIGEYTKRNFPESRWVSISPQLADVQYALGGMVGRWNALTSDVNYLRQLLVTTPGTAITPRLYNLNITVGLTAWEKVAQDATVFVTTLPAQRKFLSGENYYEECPLREGVWYELRNQFLADKEYVLTAQNTSLQMQQRTASGAGGQQWQFQRFGRGWWRVINRQSDASASLDVLNDESKNYPPRMVSSTPGQFTGQWWRCLPTEAPGWFRFINAFLGEFRSLDTYSDTYEAFMATTENRSGQYWRFVEATQ